ncbi:MAG: ribonucleoside-diphosphate reductase, adenosylcobalamin-dependent [Candidatus Liptonbacteria bacterium RIFCSPHIGHO2_01_FULL_57_28]|uniref:Vitamin B12-dependent ribonucleotide reductase n=1 Tax=Candidatus Liptonbacteria bacterium RIFCSPHIGHO2_01_FULL_57_28 TaxID=1798647 RepID=A0A1G2CDZ0_9BACT|nr:MAG: ribonucleoside-diphosphate reductase, adenosylcobalamin-dependent [Candidatus Liptonbacteria bacterium RIFCSPHIGHO2_01_FULL_57_28]
MPKTTINETAVKTPLATRFFTRPGVHPFDEVNWVMRQVTVRGPEGAIERELEFPDFWSDAACRIVGSKYFRGRIGTAEWETSAKQMITRIAGTFREWGERCGYLEIPETAEAFEHELIYILLHQRAAFNSPVWFNVGIDKQPQCSACFILKVEDSMDSILEWIQTEGLIFKRGSGAGVNLSPLRGTQETLSAGGQSSGPVSFMRGADAVAGMIASGGSTRRAAKMVVMNSDHPDIMKFITAKAEEEKKVRALIDAGYNMYDLNDPAWNSIQYQNANNSVRVTDEFMEAAARGGEWQTKFVTSGQTAETYRAADVMRAIAEAAWACGDPGMQFDTTINRWHTCPRAGRINASNPCSEFMHIDNSSCNLASINLLPYLNPDRTFDAAGFKHTVDIMFLAQEIIVDNASYPTEKIGKNSRDFRQIGLGYANIGALLMTLGYPYDSEPARAGTAAITALMTGEAYRFSAEIAGRKGPFAGYAANRRDMLRVIGMHKAALDGVRADLVFDRNLDLAARDAWREAVALGRRHGYRNSQATVLAPTGTIALMMDCATTGIEPEFALVKMKQLVGGGSMKFVNTTVENALRNLGYADSEIAAIEEYIKEEGTIEGAPRLRDEHLAVFDCAVKPANGARVISWEGHVKMVAAVQPFLSGAVSKTFNMSHEATVEDILQAYTMGWKMGLKAFAVYRDGSKSAQPLTTGARREAAKAKPLRLHLPPTRQSETHKFSIAGHEGYLTYSMFENGDLAEVFIRMSKQGSILAGLLDSFAIAISVALQYGVPLRDLVAKFSHTRFEPAGFTNNRQIPGATSIIDYIFRYLGIRFLSFEDQEDLGITPAVQELPKETTTAVPVAAAMAVADKRKTAPVLAGTICKACGGMMIQTGSCKTCIQCGTSNGGC